MKKEVIVAIILGLSLGLIVSYGLYRARKSLQSASQSVSDATPVPSPSGNSSLILFSPADESIQTTKDLKVTGTTKPNALVVIFVNDVNHITTADNTGNFSISTELQTEANTITVRSIDEDGQTTEEQRTVILEPNSLDEAPTASYSAIATPSAQLSTTKTSRRKRYPPPTPSSGTSSTSP